jgi:hypothetical protein
MHQDPSALELAFDYHVRKIVLTEDKAVRDGLISLGWIPPKVSKEGDQQMNETAILNEVKHELTEERIRAKKSALKVCLREIERHKQAMDDAYRRLAELEVKPLE